MIFVSQNNFKLFSVRNMIQVIDSIPWVRCASGNVFQLFSTFFQLFFLQIVYNFFSAFSSPFFFNFSQLFLNFFNFFFTSFSTFFLFNFHLHQFQFWSPGDNTCKKILHSVNSICSKGLVRWHHLH